METNYTLDNITEADVQKHRRILDATQAFVLNRRLGRQPLEELARTFAVSLAEMERMETRAVNKVLKAKEVVSGK